MITKGNVAGGKPLQAHELCVIGHENIGQRYSLRFDQVRYNVVADIVTEIGVMGFRVTEDPAMHDRRLRLQVKSLARRLLQSAKAKGRSIDKATSMELLIGSENIPLYVTSVGVPMHVISTRVCAKIVCPSLNLDLMKGVLSDIDVVGD